MSKYQIDKQNKINLQNKMLLQEIIHQGELKIIYMPSNKNQTENQSYHLASNHLRKESIKMIKFIIEKRSKKEGNSKNNKKDMKEKDKNNIIKGAIRKIKIRQTIKMYGTKYSRSKNRNQDLQLKKQVLLQRIIRFIMLIDWKKIQAWQIRILEKLGNIKNHG